MASTLLSQQLAEAVKKLREGQVNEVDALLTDLQKATSAPAEPEPPPPPRAREVVLYELLTAFIEHIGSPAHLVALLKEYAASKNGETA